MELNNLYLKLCNQTQGDVVIKPKIPIQFNTGEVWFDSNGICWQVMGQNTFNTVTTSYSNWGTFTKYTNNDCQSCINSNNDLIPKLPFIKQLSYDTQPTDCSQNCPEPPKKKTSAFECPPGVITKFPLTVECVIKEPSNAKINDGEICLKINGGTKPYKIKWEGRDETTSCLKNLGGGSYTATITDKFGDYTTTKTCIIEPIISAEVCFIYQLLECFGGSLNQTINEKITSFGVFNTRPYFIFSDYCLYWEGSRWEFRTDLGSGTLISYLETTNDLPLGENWVNLIGNNPAIIYSSLNCINTDICLGFDETTFETYLKYAEAVGLTQTAAVP